MNKTNIHYFAYGSNLSYQQMRMRCPHAHFVAKAKLVDYKIVIAGYSSRWHTGPATLLKEKGAEVWGVVYKLDKDCLQRLDGFEGLKYRRYSKKSVTCHFSNGKTRLVTTYIKEPKKLTHTNKLYRNTIISGARYFELPPAYIKQLQTNLK
jgi:gamma-glutamylcyclotransferase (GGCT)/AIG2-like uncharacterized protein YtfP